MKHFFRTAPHYSSLRRCGAATSRSISFSLLRGENESSSRRTSHGIETDRAVSATEQRQQRQDDDEDERSGSVSSLLSNPTRTGSGGNGMTRENHSGGSVKSTTFSPPSTSSSSSFALSHFSASHDRASNHYAATAPSRHDLQRYVKEYKKFRGSHFSYWSHRRPRRGEGKEEEDEENRLTTRESVHTTTKGLSSGAGAPLPFSLRYAVDAWRTLHPTSSWTTTREMAQLAAEEGLLGECCDVFFAAIPPESGLGLLRPAVERDHRTLKMKHIRDHKEGGEVKQRLLGKKAWWWDTAGTRNRESPSSPPPPVDATNTSLSFSLLPRCGLAYDDQALLRVYNDSTAHEGKPHPARKEDEGSPQGREGSLSSFLPFWQNERSESVLLEALAETPSCIFSAAARIVDDEEEEDSLPLTFSSALPCGFKPHNPESWSGRGETEHREMVKPEKNNSISSSSVLWRNAASCRHLSHLVNIIHILQSLPPIFSEREAEERGGQSPSTRRGTRRHGVAASLALRLYFSCVWEILNTPKEQRNQEESEQRRKRREEKLRAFAMEALNCLGFRSHSSIAPHRILTPHQNQEKHYRIVQNFIDTSIRLIQYRWSALLPRGHRSNESTRRSEKTLKNEREEEEEGALFLHRFPSILPTSRQEWVLGEDAMATVWTEILRVYLEQEEMIHKKKEEKKKEHCLNEEREKRRRGSPSSSFLQDRDPHAPLPSAIFPEVYVLILHAANAARRWDIASYISLLADQFWHTRLRYSGSHRASRVLPPVMEGSKAEDGDKNVNGVGTIEKEVVTSTEKEAGVTRRRDGSSVPTPASPRLQRSEEELILQQLRFFHASREGKRGLEWWSWLQVQIRAGEHSIVPSIPILTTLARLAGEFSMTRAFRSIPPPRRGQAFWSPRRAVEDAMGTTEKEGRSVPLFTPRLAAAPGPLALWCLETMLDSRQPTPPSGDALLGAVEACARASLPELESVLHSLVDQNHVLIVTGEEKMHVRLLHCRHDIHWKARLESLVPLLSKLPCCHVVSQAIQKRHSLAPKGESSSTATSPSTSFLPLPPFPVEDERLSVRNVYAILLLLQEGNHLACLPFYLYMRYHFTAGTNNTSPIPVLLSDDQQCRWLLLALVYATVNAHALPREWIWRIAAEALFHLQSGLMTNKEREPHDTHPTTTLEELEGEVEDEPQSPLLEKEEGGRYTSVQSFLGKTAERRAGTLSTAFTSPGPYFVAPDTWQSIIRKWEALHAQFSSSYWEAFREALQQRPPPRAPKTTTPKNSPEHDWVSLLSLPSDFRLSSLASQRFLRQVEIKMNPKEEGSLLLQAKRAHRFISRRSTFSRFMSSDAFPSASAFFKSQTNATIMAASSSSSWWQKKCRKGRQRDAPMWWKGLTVEKEEEEEEEKEIFLLLEKEVGLNPCGVQTRTGMDAASSVAKYHRHLWQLKVLSR